jgi:hypothetical protein
MAFSSAKNLIATVADATPKQFDDWRKSWRAAATGGSTEPLLTFVARERGLAEDVFLQKLAAAIGWPFIDLRKHTVPVEARNKIPPRSRSSIPCCRLPSTTACCSLPPAIRSTRR